LISKSRLRTIYLNLKNYKKQLRKKHRQEIQRLLKDKEEKLLNQIDAREVKIILLEDTLTSSSDDTVLLITFPTMDQPKMTLEDQTVPKNVNNSSGHGHNRPSGPTSPKMGTITGKEDRHPYFLQFCHIANDYKWSDQDRLDKLIECLRDRALRYFRTRPKYV
jgi:hypothetical protein